MEQKSELKKKLPELIPLIDDGEIKQVDLEKKYGVPKSTLSRWISETRKKMEEKVPKVPSKTEQKTEQKVEQQERKKNPPGSGGGRKPNIQKEKELIEYKALSEYIAINKLAHIYKDHFNNKTIRVTDRLKSYINKPEGMIRMSLIMGGAK